mgnify:FL=1
MKTTISNLTPKLMEIFHHLHANPEISGKEVETTKFIRSLFQDKQCNMIEFDDLTGLVVEIGEGKPVVAVRADIDALWQEVDGKFQANHSCGHDAHMTIAIGTIFTLLEHHLPRTGTVRIIFQPAEETGKGALAYTEKGIIDDVDFLYGMHLRPIEELSFGKYAPAIQHGAAAFIKGEIIGDDAHGARPHLNTNAIEVGAEFVQHLNQMKVNPAVPHSVKMTQFQAGGKSINIIPGNATFSLDVRAQTNEVMEQLTSKIKQISQLLATYHDIEINIEEVAQVAAAVLNDEAIDYMKRAIIDTVGERNLAPIIETTGGDDFHFYTLKRPHVKATMLAIGCDLTPGLHHPKMTFNHEVIPTSVEILTNVVLTTLNSEAK